MRTRNPLLFVAKRLALLIPQLIGISVVTFLFLHLLPGNPAYLIAGNLATPEAVRAIEHHLGLDKPLFVQYVIYVGNVLHGDLGQSWLSGNAVLTDLLQRVPATIELVSIALIVIAVVGILLGVLIAVNPRGLIARVVFGYGLLAGALPDFWIGLILIFILYYKLRLFPPPLGQLDLGVTAPRTITGMYLIDSLLTANGPAFGSSLRHLILPEMTLIFVYMGLVVRMAASSMQNALRADYIRTARASGLNPLRVIWQALRNALPPVLTILGISYAYLLGGAVLVETIFAWGGIGQYAVQAVTNSDYLAIEGFVLTAAIFTMLVYLLVDIGHFFLDPRVTV
jgi:ABC-type dipeptide/oligopeptide/nickel transport system permease component